MSYTRDESKPILTKMANSESSLSTFLRELNRKISVDIKALEQKYR